jgi:hypothetical protein
MRERTPRWSVRGDAIRWANRGSRGEGCRKVRGAMQMGPASLPTPLSPACGWPSFPMRPANLPLHPRGAMLGARCLASRCPAMRLACRRFVTGARAGIRLPLRLAVASLVRREPFEFRRRAFAWPRPSSLYRSRGLRLGGFRRFRCTCARPGSWPVRCHRVAPCRGEPTCLPPKPPACRLRPGAWTDATAILETRTSVTSKPCGPMFPLLLVPKTVSKCA